MSYKPLRQLTILRQKNKQFRLLGHNNFCRISFGNTCRPTKLAQPIDPPLFLGQDLEEEHLETSNAQIITSEEDSKLTIDPLVIWETIIKETKPEIIQEDQTISTIQLLLQEA